MAVWAGAEAAVSLHIARGDDPDGRDDTGLTPLMIAAARNKSVVCRLLVEAGADLSALDPAGQTALEIAIANGADEAAATIKLALAKQLKSASAPDVEQSPSDRASIDQPASEIAEQPPAHEARHIRQRETGQTELALIDFEDDGEPLDLSGWETEDESAPPVDDRPAVVAHMATHEAIARRPALDDSADWVDIEADLPVRAASFPSAVDSESQGGIRALLLRASREGSVPEQAVEEACRDAIGSRDPDAESLVGMVLNDMGAETDERFEFRSPFDNFETWVDPSESDIEAQTVNEGLHFLDNLRSPHNDPFRLYMREAQRTALLSAQEEVELSQAMDRAVDVAMDALSCWRAGIDSIVDAIQNARRGARSAGSIASIARDAMEAAGLSAVDVGFIEESNPVEASLDISIGDADEVDETTQLGPEVEALGVYALAQELASILNAGIPGREEAIRATLVALAPRRSFLIEVSDNAADGTAECSRYTAAIRDLLVSRDRMVRANLRLVISMARKYLYSGIPVDDLVQDGNIGLMISVDKFDWRRGFRFSTMATWWIRQQITRSIADSSLNIRLPVHVFEIAQRFPPELEALEKELGCPPTIRQLADRVGHETGKIERLLRACSDPLPIELLDEEPNLDIDSEIEPFEKVSFTDLRRTLDAVLGELDVKQEKIVRLRYGIGSCETQTLEEVGVLFNVTRERIRQIESKALKKLKAPSRLARLSWWALNADQSMAWASEPADEHAGCLTLSELEAPAATRVVPQGFGKVATAESGKRLSHMEQVLRKAKLLDIPVEQRMDGNETTTWVLLTEACDNQRRKLIRSLLGLGFEFWPGTGYWR